MKINIEGKFYKFLYFIADLALLNLCFIIGSLPLITIGASISSCYKIIFKMIRKEDVFVVKDYIKAYQENFKNGILLQLLHTFLIAWFVFCFTLFYNQDNFIFKVYFIIIYLSILATITHILYSYAMLGRYQNNLITAIKNSFKISIINYQETIIMFLILFTIYALCFYNNITIIVSSSIFLTFGFALMFYILGIYLLKVFSKYEK